VHTRERRRIAGYLELERARVRWFLSTDIADLPAAATSAGRSTFRSISVDGGAIEFSDGFSDLHTRIDQDALAGRGFGIADSRPAIELAYRIKTATPDVVASRLHPFAAARL